MLSENPCLYCDIPVYEEAPFCSDTCYGWWTIEEFILEYCETIFRLVEPDHSKDPEVPF